jgi:4'-phosphopantetheinyl transferase
MNAINFSLPYKTAEKLPVFFRCSQLPKAVPAKEEAVIILSQLANIKEVKLPDHELQRAEKIFHQPSRDRYLAGRFLLRGILSRLLSIPPQDLAIKLSDTGKPFLPESGIQFSMSHTDRLLGAVFAFASGSENDNSVGIDLEQKRPVDVSALAHRFFSPDEATILQESQSLDDFFRFWCAREAAIKADGRGLGSLLALTRVLSPQRTDGECVEVMIEEVSWSVYPWKLRGGIHGAVAFQHSPRVIHWCDLRVPLV